MNDPPLVEAASFTVAEEAEIGDFVGTIVANDVDSDSIEIRLSSSHLSVNADGLVVLLVPASELAPITSVKAIATDDDGATGEATVTVTRGSTTTTSATTTTVPTTTTTTVPTTTTTTAPPTTTTTTSTTTTTTAPPPPPGAGLVISEFAADGANPSGDFVELYNGSGGAIDLSTIDVDLLDDAGLRETVDLGSGTLPAGAHLLLAHTGSALESTADVIFTTPLPLSIAIAIDDGSGYLDVVGTRNRPENKPSVVAASAVSEGLGVPPFDPDATSNPQSYVRRHGTTGGSCIDTDNNSADFIRSFHAAGVTPTPSSAGPVACGSAGSSPGTPLTVVIAEIRTDGPGSGRNEFVELFNPTPTPQALSGLKLVDDDGDDEFVFTTELLAPGQRLLIAHPDFTGPAPDRTYANDGVKNGGGLRLEVVGTGLVVDQVSFGGSAPELPPLGGRLNHSYTRRYGGCIDTGDYYVDFEHALIETPQTSAATPTPC
ncbi:MAG: lamin tail domain-containing protein [Actinomycetota bacterium]